MTLGVDSNHSFRPSFFSKASHFPRVLGGLLERRIPGKNGEVTPRVTRRFNASKVDMPKESETQTPKAGYIFCGFQSFAGLRAMFVGHPS